ncbi:hypothetical protein [Streptacidiphilus sp. P02-A3a]|uniref:hypothetical protein n=1 Tax=Streptacidiphilus sp. P02-A3a TaxID=2704468 RepID=UPI0015FBF50D|nr:hypothetical protein [Streptacidiphilus sp. P02-A3a]QMU71483.1 hypothetical protein GXP74_27855 [Streptacidiphilus sp. P02-A3a]
MSDNTASSSSLARIGGLAAAAIALGAGAVAAVSGARAKQDGPEAAGTSGSDHCPGPCHPEEPTPE